MLDDNLERAIALSRSGKKAEAREILKAILRSNPQNETAWLWFADTFPDNHNRIAVLEECLKHNPDSQAAQKRLATFKSEEAKTSTTIQLQKSGAQTIQIAQPKQPINKPLPARNLSQKPNIKQSIKIKQCPFCAEEIQDAAKVCRFCGRELPVRSRRSPAKSILAFFGTICLLVIIITASVMGTLYLNSTKKLPAIPFMPTPVPDPAKEYSQDIGPIVEKLNQWNSEYNAIADEWLEKPNILRGYNISLEIYYKDEEIINTLVDPLEILISDGQDILNVIGVVTPPDDIRSAHEQVVNCINKRIQFMQKVSLSISAWVPIEYIQSLSELSVCLAFNAAVTKLETYVNSSK